MIKGDKRAASSVELISEKTLTMTGGALEIAKKTNAFPFKTGESKPQEHSYKTMLSDILYQWDDSFF